MKKYARTIFSLLIAPLFLASCGGGNTSSFEEIIIDNNEKTTFSLNVSSLSLMVGETFSLSPKAYVSSEGLLWYSSAKSIVSVDKNGNIEALDQGSAVISAYDSNSVGSVRVNVTAPEGKLTISLSTNQLKIGIGEDYACHVSACVKKDGAQTNAYSISAILNEESEAGVASLTREGEYYLVTGLKEGEALYSFTVNDGTTVVGANLYVSVIDLG